MCRRAHMSEHTTRPRIATPKMTTMIDTRHVTNVRSLAFKTVDDAMAEAESLVQAEREGRLERLGNWTLGQALGHLAAWASYPYEGYPSKPPAVIRWLGRFMKKRILSKPLPKGYKLPGVPGGTFGIDVIPTDEGLGRFRAALLRLQAVAPSHENPVFGRLTHAEWIRLNLGHAELHLGFFRVK